MYAVLINPEEVILEEIANPKMTRNNVALSYAFCLRQRSPGHGNFGVVNRAILARWSSHGLEYIKRHAWKLYTASPQRSLWRLEGLGNGGESMSDGEATPADPAAIDLVKRWKEAARRDDLFDHMVPSDVRLLLKEIEALRERVAELHKLAFDDQSGKSWRTVVLNNDFQAGEIDRVASEYLCRAEAAEVRVDELEDMLPKTYSMNLAMNFQKAERRAEALAGALEFYADPNTYIAIGFLPDPPCGDFMDDFEELEGELGHPDGGTWTKPGKRARAALGATPKSYAAGLEAAAECAETHGSTPGRELAETIRALGKEEE